MEKHFVANESLFIIDMDDTSESVLKIGEVFPDGIKIAVDRDRGEDFTFYVSEDGRYDVLAAAPSLAERWVREGYLEKRMLQPHFTDAGEIDCYLLISPSSHVLLRLTEARAHGNRYYAHMVACAIWRTRNIDPFINLRDGILCEVYNVVLPTFTKTPRVADAALFNNVLRSQFEPEDLRSPEEFGNGGGLGTMSFNEAFNAHKMERDPVEPYFHVGEPIDDFIQIKTAKMITGALEIRKEYQIFSTDSDLVLLVMDNNWADQLFQHGLLMEMDIKPVQLGRSMVKVLPLSRRKAVESINNRHFGITQRDLFDFALAVRRLREKLPNAVVSDALYVQELGIILPVNFDDAPEREELAVVRDVGATGPFAQGPFLNDVLIAALGMVN